MTQQVTVCRFDGGDFTEAKSDDIAVEEPLEIRVEGESLSIAMRTPGQDAELAAGWLLSEGIVRSGGDIAEIVCCPGGDAQNSARVDVILNDPAGFIAAKHRRSLVTNSSCGLCGAATVGQVMRNFGKIETPFLIDADVLFEMPARLSARQAAFRRTGGMHACGLFDAAGELLALREDVGRHNALDKLLGWALLSHMLPLSSNVVFLSGRVSFEMMQKALAASVPIVAAIGAPSSLAVDLAARSGQTLAAFIRGRSMNVYAGAERLRGAGRP
jgi:FdhD protein